MKKKIIRKILLCILIVFLLFSTLLCLRYQHTSSKRLPEKWKGDVIAQYHSSLDKDGDGIDDQVDILEGAIAYALKAAGYDLMELVSADIAMHADVYDIEVADKNIDFRRVKNLYVFFNLNAECLTTDINDIKSWQGGDIVIFNNHIAIVSDRRNQDGIPYVIHHANPFQKSYEEDILEKHDDIRGHYRWNKG